MIAEESVAWIADALVLLGCLVMTMGVVGVLRMPDVYSKLHAASKSVFLGVCSILAAAAAHGDGAIVARAVLIFVLLILTTPVAAYEMARAFALEDSFSPTRSGKPSNAGFTHQGAPTRRSAARDARMPH